MCGFGDRLRGAGSDGSSALKTEEFAGLAASFDHAVGDQSQLLILGKLEMGLWIGGCCVDTQRQTTFDVQFVAVDIWDEVPGVGDYECAVEIGAQDKAGGFPLRP